MNGMHLRVRCPAKINLFLSVGPIDARRYHPLRTLFQTIELSDWLDIQPAEGRHLVECNDPSVPENNTVTKALRLLNEVLPLPRLHVRIEKAIPAESGLGGGSSNAAGIIRAAQKIAGKVIPMGELKGIAEAIGMDVPFFLVGGTAQAEGYGERLTPLEDLPSRWIVVARPGVGCGTAEAYRKLDSIEREWKPFADGDQLYNDFERVCPCECLDLMERLVAVGAIDAGLTGSGSAVFGRFDSESAARSSAGRLTGTAQSVWVTRYLPRSEALAIG
jgi:4-diphosphocytidyl-2-C-methyl-D-erythritol kinase